MPLSGSTAGQVVLAVAASAAIIGGIVALLALITALFLFPATFIIAVPVVIGGLLALILRLRRRQERSALRDAVERPRAPAD